MSDEYVSKEKALGICEMFRATYEGSQSRIDEVIGQIANCIEGQLAADVVPVVRSEWVNVRFSADGNSSADCNRCGATVHTSFSNSVNFCPNCGADMRKETKDD